MKVLQLHEKAPCLSHLTGSRLACTGQKLFIQLVQCWSHGNCQTHLGNDLFEGLPAAEPTHPHMLQCRVMHPYHHGGHAVFIQLSGTPLQGLVPVCTGHQPLPA